MNRRGFLGALMGGLVFDPERALWSPDRCKLISIPKPRKILRRFFDPEIERQWLASRLSGIPLL